MGKDSTPSPLDPDENNPFTDSTDEFYNNSDPKNPVENVEFPPDGGPDGDGFSSFVEDEPPILEYEELSLQHSPLGEEISSYGLTEERNSTFARPNRKAILGLATIIFAIFLGITIPKLLSNDSGDKSSGSVISANDESGPTFMPTPEPTSPQQPPPTIKDPVDLFQTPPNLGTLKSSLEQAIVDIFCPSSGGTGWAFQTGNEILLVTNYHVIEDCVMRSENPFFYLSGGIKEYNADVIGFDPEKDIALLRILDPHSLQPLPVSAEFDAPQWVITVGFPASPDGPEDIRAYEATWSTGNIQRGGTSVSFEFEGYEQGTMEVIYITAEINSGNSGGPLINAAGEVIGIISGDWTEFEGFNFAIEVSELCNLLLNCSTDPWSLR